MVSLLVGSAEHTEKAHSQITQGTGTVSTQKRALL